MVDSFDSGGPLLRMDKGWPGCGLVNFEVLHVRSVFLNLKYRATALLGTGKERFAHVGDRPRTLSRGYVACTRGDNELRFISTCGRSALWYGRGRTWTVPTPTAISATAYTGATRP